MIEACIVNHDTSDFAELCLRSLLATHRAGAPLELRVTVADNHSSDEGLDELRSACDELGADFECSRWPIEDTTGRFNSHGDVLRDFVLAHADAEYFLLVDSDIEFTTDGVVGRMRDELDADPCLWAVQARFWSTEHRRGSGASLDMGAGNRWPVAEVRDPLADEIVARDLIGYAKPRSHPGCTLVRPSDAFLRTAERIGLSTSVIASGDPAIGGFQDTLGLASTVLGLQGLRYELSAETVVHYFNVSYDERTDLTASKREDCRRQLDRLRRQPDTPRVAGPWG